MGVLRFAPPVSVSLWDVHHNFWNEHHSKNQTTSGVITKMRLADSAFPRANLAIVFVVSITNRRTDEVVHTPN
jgi:hypothetical protein